VNSECLGRYSLARHNERDWHLTQIYIGTTHDAARNNIGMLAQYAFYQLWRNIFTASNYYIF